MVEDRELTADVHMRLSSAKTIREEARTGQGMRSASSIQFAQNHAHCTRSGQHCLMPVRAKEGALGNKRRKRLGTDAAQVEGSTDSPGGEEHELQFLISSVLYES